MKLGDASLTPQVNFLDTKASIEAYPSPQEGMTAQQTDSPYQKAHYGNGAWIWEGGGGGGSVDSVTGDGVDNADPANPVLTFPTPSDIGAMRELTVTNITYLNDPYSVLPTDDIIHVTGTCDIVLPAATGSVRKTPLYVIVGANSFTTIYQSGGTINGEVTLAVNEYGYQILMDFDTNLWGSFTHQSNHDTNLGLLTTKNVPTDLDRVVYRNVEAIPVYSLVTSTWAEVKAFLKTYFDTIYQAVGTYLTSANITQVITNGVTDKAPSEDAVFDALAGKQTSLGFTPENVANKDATGGYAGLTLFKINFKNVANTFTSFFTNSNTAARTYTFKDADGTVAFISDITGTNSGTNTGDETGARLATLHHAASAKTSLVDADEVVGGDSAASFGLIRTTWTNVKAFLKTYFDTLYAVAGHDQTKTLAAGTWTPTLTNISNVAASTAHLCNYLRVGNQVTVNGIVEVDTTAAGAFILLMSLPIASNFTTVDDANGNGTQPGAGIPNIISFRESTGSDAFQLDGYAQTNANIYYRFVAGYIIK